MITFHLGWGKGRGIGLLMTKAFLMKGRRFVDLFLVNDPKVHVTTLFHHKIFGIVLEEKSHIKAEFHTNDLDIWGCSRLPSLAVLGLMAL